MVRVAGKRNAPLLWRIEQPLHEFELLSQSSRSFDRREVEDFGGANAEFEVQVLPFRHYVIDDRFGEILGRIDGGIETDERTAHESAVGDRSIGEVDPLA